MSKLAQFMFDSYGTYDDFGLILQDYEIESPEVKTNYVEIPYRSGKLDFTQNSYFGDRIFYNDRDLKADFVLLGSKNRWQEVYTQLMTKIHGKRFLIEEPPDSEFLYQGRLSVGSLQREVATAKVEITGVLDPFKIKRTITSKTVVFPTGAVNYINNGDFTQDFSGWTTWSNAVSTKTRDQVYLISREAKQATDIGIESSAINLQKNVNYTLSFKALSYWQNEFNYLYLIHKSGNQLLDASKLIDHGPTKVPVLGDDDYSHLYTLSFKVSSNLENVRILIGNHDLTVRDNPSGFYITEIQLEEGTSATAYSNSLHDKGLDQQKITIDLLAYPVMPTIQTDHPIIISYNGEKFTFFKGKSFDPNLEFSDQAKELSIVSTMSGKVKVNYQESRL